MKKYTKVAFILWVILILLAYFGFFYFNGGSYVGTYLMGAEEGTVMYLYTALFIIFLYIIHPLILLPSSLITPIVGTIFGPQAGVVIAYFGALSSTAVSFFLSRFLGKTYFVQSESALALRFNKKVEKDGFLITLLLHLGPVFPFDLINYSGGLSKIKFQTYFFATALGIIPGVFISVFLGSSIFNPHYLVPTLLLFCVTLLFGTKYFLKKT